MASSPITSQQIEGKKWKQWQIFFSWAPNHGGWWHSNEVKRCLFLARKDMTNPDSILKSRGTTLPTKVHIVEAMVFPVVTHKTECWRTGAFDFWYWRRQLKVPWTTKKSNQSILKKINPEYSLEGVLLKLKLQFFGTWCKEPTHRKSLWCWERLRAREEVGDRGWDGSITLPTQWTWVWADSRR